MVSREIKYENAHDQQSQPWARCACLCDADDERRGLVFLDATNLLARGAAQHLILEDDQVCFAAIASSGRILPEEFDSLFEWCNYG